MKKRILSLIVAVCLMFTILPTAAFAASGTKYPPSDSGNPSWDVGFPYPNSVTATLIGTKLTVKGTGKMKNFDGGIPAPWSEKLIASVIIDNGVQSIGDKAFFNCYMLSSVTIPATVREIGDKAFGFESGRGEVPRNITMYFNFDEEKSMSHTSFCDEDNINLEIS
ncbi:MAG: leucine-rich repeat protein, partial [Hydrogenoanaerobacterium sp.]